MKLRPRNKAILLITTLIFSTLLLMGLVATLGMSDRALLGAENAEDFSTARTAVEAGAEYALVRLQERPTWRGDGDGIDTSQVVVDEPNFVVIEDNGDVIGFMQVEGGTPSQFRIRFNFHDGDASSSSDADGLDDPEIVSLPGPWISINNLMSEATTPIPRAETTASGLWTVEPGSPMPSDAPSFTACIIVEGIAGEGLREQLRGAAPQPEPLAGGPTVARQVGEFYFQRGSRAAADAASYSAGDLDVTVSPGGALKVEAATSGDVGRVRSNANVELQATAGSATYDSPGGEVYVADTVGEFNVNGAPSTAPNPTQRTTRKGEFFELKWSDVKKAETGSPEVRAGTYIWRDPTPTTPGHLEYYAEDYDPVSGSYPPGLGTVISDGDDMLTAGTAGAPPITLDPAFLKVQISDDIVVQPVSGGVSSLTIIPEAGITSSGRRPTVEFVGSGTDTPILTSTGGVNLGGRLTGDGSIVSEGDLYFQGSSALEARSGDVALYARGDIVLEAIPDPVVSATGGTIVTLVGMTGGGAVGGCGPACGTGGGGGGAPTQTPITSFGAPLEFQDQEFRGVIFTAGDFIANLDGGTFRGSLAIQGVLSAYGGDPDAGDAPGDGGNGMIRINASNAGLVYDPQFVDKILDLNAPTPLVTTFSVYHS